MSELTKALVKARARLTGAVFKGGVNSHQRYAYVGHEHVIMGGARTALLAEGLVLVQRKVEYVGEVPGGKVQALLWRGLHVLKHDSGESEEYEFLATTQANDKSAFVASTSLDRLAHLRVLELAGSAEEDPEHDVHDRRSQSQEQRPNGNGQRSQEAPQNGHGPSDQYATSVVVERLYATTDPKELAELQAAARARYRQLPRDEQEAIKQAVDYAIARMAQLEEDRKDAERVEAEIAREKQLLAEAEARQAGALHSEAERGEPMRGAP